MDRNFNFMYMEKNESDVFKKIENLIVKIISFKSFYNSFKLTASFRSRLSDFHTCLELSDF